MARSGTSGQGRPKGIPNKDNGDIKALVIGALHAAGGVEYLRQRAFDQPVAFMGLVGKVLPLQITGKDGGALHVEFRWADETPVAVIDGTVSSETNTVSDETTDNQPELIEWAEPEAAD